MGESNHFECVAFSRRRRVDVGIFLRVPPSTHPGERLERITELSHDRTLNCDVTSGRRRSQTLRRKKARGRLASRVIAQLNCTSWVLVADQLR